MCMVLHLSLQTSSNDGRIELESNNAGVTVGVIILRLKWDAMCEQATTRNFFYILLLVSVFVWMVLN